MSDDEGSVIVDGYDSESEDETEESQEPEVESAPLKEEPKAEEEPEKEPKVEEPEKTWKGTVKDPNPESAIHQELANERRLRVQMEKVLSTPELLTKYLEESGLKKPEAEPEVEEFTPDKLQSAEDVIKALNEMNSKVKNTSKTYEEKIRNLESELGRIQQVGKAQTVAANLETDASWLREQYPELKPGTDSYSEKIEKSIVDMYHKFDFDPNSQSYRGNVSLREIGKMVMDAASEFRKKGSEEAQTTVKDKSLGKVMTSKPSQKVEAQSDDPSTEIARRINRLIK